MATTRVLGNTRAYYLVETSLISVAGCRDQTSLGQFQQETAREVVRWEGLDDLCSTP